MTAEIGEWRSETLTFQPASKGHLLGRSILSAVGICVATLAFEGWLATSRGLSWSFVVATSAVFLFSAICERLDHRDASQIEGVADLADDPAPTETWTVDISYFHHDRLAGEVLTGADCGTLTVVDGWLVFQGLRSDFSLQSRDVGDHAIERWYDLWPKGPYRSLDKCAIRLWMRPQDGVRKAIGISPRRDSTDREADAAGDAIEKWLKDLDVVAGNSRFPPTAPDRHAFDALALRRWKMLYAAGVWLSAIMSLALLLAHWPLEIALSILLLYEIVQGWRAGMQSRRLKALARREIEGHNLRHL